MYFVRDGLTAFARQHRALYQLEDPFPHIVIDDAFPASCLDEVQGDFPHSSQINWTRFAGSHHLKLLSKGDAELAPPIRHLLAQLRTCEFLSFLEELSGVRGLVANPHVGGAHVAERGGHLDIHVDASWDQRLELYTGVNLFVYLNKGWQDEYGGHLELWDEEMTVCRKRVQPVFNRMVIFNPGARTFHGHPDPVRCPVGQSRRSIAANYCTSVKPRSHRPWRHSELYRARPSDPIRWSLTAVAAAVTPPALHEAIRRLRHKARRRPW
jgi:2-oxoglutarate-Fe(II)-dependent oxygenase superfamily protein